MLETMSEIQDADMRPAAVGHEEQPEISGSGAGEMDCDHNLSDAEARFREFCRVNLELDENYMAKAVKLFRDTEKIMVDSSSAIGSSAEETEKIWTASILYVVQKMDKREVPSYTLTQILLGTRLSVVDFFKEFNHFLSKCETHINSLYGDEDLEMKLQVEGHRASFVHQLLLFKYYQRLYSDLFLCPEEEVPPRMKFGWLLFLAVRTHVLNRFPDLVTCTTAALSVLTMLTIHMPTSLRKFSLENPSFLTVKNNWGEINLVASFSQKGNASEEEVRNLLEKAQSVIAQILHVGGKPASKDVERLSGLETAGLTYFEGLLDDESLQENMGSLNRDYESSLNRRGGLDERLCVYGEEGYDILAASLQKSSQSIGSQSQSPSGSPCSSPANLVTQQLPPTPVSTAMSTAKWLRTVIAPCSAEPSESLLAFFKACDRDITEEVTFRTKVLVEAIFPIPPRGSWKVLSGSMDSSWSEQRRLESRKLYYRVLCEMCRAESQRLQNNNLTPLLTNEKFHRCMIACSAELVLITHKTVIMTFPAVLQPTGITAFDLCKVIEFFVRHEATLPKELKRHLNNIEEKLLESMAWEKGSSMYNYLIVARPKLAAEITRLNLLADPMPSLDMLAPRTAEHQAAKPEEATTDGYPGSPERESMITSERGDTSRVSNVVSPARPSAFSAFNPAKRNMSQLQSVFASPQRPNPQAGGETCAETVISVFYQKVLKLVANRIKYLCERIQQISHMKSMYQVVQFALHNTTPVFFMRHIDQIMLCSVYGVCKVLKLSVTFKSIIYHYRKQPQAKNMVFRNVFLDLRRGVHETGDIIKFYNDCFIPAVKSFLINLGPTAPQALPPRSAPEDADKVDRNPGPGTGGPTSPKPSTTFPSLPDMSPKKVSSKHNVYVSPLRNTKVENIMSPHSRSLYACVGESTHAYQSPSKDLTAINNRLNNRRMGRLDFDEGSLVSDSFVAGDFCPCIPQPLPASDNPPSSSWSIPAPQSPPPKRQKLDR